jgi:hypothetical protein
MPGYLPMADEPATFESFADAKQYIIDELDRGGDDMFAAGETSDERGVADEWSAVAEELNLTNGPEWDVYVPTSTSEHDLGLHWWIVQCADDCEVDQ